MKKLWAWAMAIALAAQAQDDRSHITTAADGTVFRLLPSRTQKVGKDLFDVWIEEIPKKRSAVLEHPKSPMYVRLLRNVRVSCAAKSLGVKVSIYYDKDGTAYTTQGSGELSPIVPESVGESVVDAACQVPPWLKDWQNNQKP